MPRYFFHIHDGRDIPDPEGTELPNLAAVKAEAVKAAGAMLRDIESLDGEWRMDIKDEADRTVLLLRFSVTEPAV